MYSKLLFEKVKCSDVGILSIMYPTFRFIHDIDSGIGDEPFIYCGSSLYIPKIEKSSVPHIIVSSNAKYDLDDRKVLMELTLEKNNCNLGINVEWLYSLSYREFIDVWKYFWVTGTLLDEEQCLLYSFDKILKNIRNPNYLFLYCIKNLDNIDIEYMTKEFLLFINNSHELNSGVTELEKLQTYFYENYSKNIPYACKNLFLSSIGNEKLRFITFIMNVIYGGTL